MPPVNPSGDAAANALRSLYVPGGLSSDRAVKEVIATSPDVKRTKALLKEAKGGAMQAMAGLVPQLDLIGRYTVMVANLKPRKMRFGVSEGMVLAAGPGGSDLFVLTPDEGARPGMRVT